MMVSELKSGDKHTARTEGELRSRYGKTQDIAVKKKRIKVAKAIIPDSY